MLPHSKFADNMHLAVLITSHNRRAITLRCIEAVTAMTPARLQIKVVLTDDGSSDGTADAVRQAFPGTDVLSGSGSLFWGGGMHAAFAHALRGDFDFYLWLNDDTMLDAKALDILLKTYHDATAAFGAEAIVVGSVSEVDGARLSYGGWRERRGGFGFLSWPSWEKQVPDKVRWTECATMNGNCVLVPRNVAARVGNLDPVFVHVGGDLDYGLRAVAAGCRIVAAPGFVGVCPTHDTLPPWRDARRPVLERWQQLLGPKGFPFKAWRVFTYRHKGSFWFVPWLAPYVEFWVSALFERKKHL